MGERPECPPNRKDKQGVGVLPNPEEMELSEEKQQIAALTMTLQLVVQCMSDLESRISAIEDKLGIERVEMPEINL